MKTYKLTFANGSVHMLTAASETAARTLSEAPGEQAECEVATEQEYAEFLSNKYRPRSGEALHRDGTHPTLARRQDAEYFEQVRENKLRRSSGADG
jgi:hypothetical protein